jgi:hypothetical protein
VAIWGFTAPSSAKEILVDSDGHLQVDILTQPPTTVDKVKVWDGTDYLEMDASGRIGVSNLPTDYFKAGQAIGESPFDITKVAGTALTGRDWSGDFAKLDVALSTRASESTLSALNGKVQGQSAGLFVKDLSVGASASQVDADTAYRDEVILLADSTNTDKVYVGTSASQLFPLAAGASVAIQKTALNLIYLRAASGTQTIHVISGGA